MGFKVIRDFTEKDKDKSAVGIESIPPKHWLQAYAGKEDDSEYPYKGGQIKIRLLDDDGNIYYHALVDDIDFSCQLALDWSGSFAGCTELDLRKEDWDRLTEGREHPYPSKDGKWVAHMS